MENGVKKKNVMELLYRYSLMTDGFVSGSGLGVALLLLLLVVYTLLAFSLGDMKGRAFFVGIVAIALIEFVLLLIERKRTALSVALVSIITNTTKGCIWEWNLTSGRFHLVPKGHFLFGKDVRNYDDFLSLLHPDDVRLFEQAARHFFTAEPTPDDTFEVEFRIQSTQGDWRWFVARSSTVQRSSKKILKVMGTMMDIDAYKRLVEAMQSSERRLETIFKSAPGSMAVTDKHGRLIDANQAFYDMLGYSAEELQGTPIMSLSTTRVGQDGEAAMQDILAECESYEDSHFHLEEDFIRSNGQHITLDYGLSVILDFDGNILNYIFSGTNITLQKQHASELKLLATEMDDHAQRLQGLHSLIHSLLRTQNRDHLLEGMLEYLKQIISKSACAVYFFVDAQNNSKKLERLAWYEDEEIPVPEDGLPMKAAVQNSPLVQQNEEGRETRRISPLIFQTHNIGAVDLCKPSGILPAELKMYQLLLDYVSSLWMLYDLMTKREEEAFIDPLTGIWNRRYMIRRLHEESDRIARYGGNACLVIGDMGNFKHTNDNYGHIKGDEVLVKSAAVIKKNLRLSDSVGRYGGDEFILLLTNVTKTDAEVVINRIKIEMKDIQIRSDDSEPDSPLISVVMDFGIAFYPGAAATLVDTINVADEEMYANKLARKENLKQQGIEEPNRG